MKIYGMIKKSKIVLDEEHRKSVLYEIEIVNLVRVRIMLVILFIIELMFIVFNDIPYLFHLRGNIIWKSSGYFVVHVLLLVMSVIGFMLAGKLLQLAEERWNRLYRCFTPVILGIYLVLISFLNTLDQLYIDKISSLLIANLLLCAGIFVLNYPKNLMIYVPPSLVYIGSFLYFEYEEQILYSNLINYIIFFVAVIVISTTIYNHQFESIEKNIILDQANNQLNYISSHDPLTGLLNRRCFMGEIEKFGESEQEPAAVIIIDIDFFKIVNDRSGHPGGDIVLKEVSSILIKYIKEEDLAVRWGGEEFLLFLYRTSTNEADIIAENIRKAIEELTIRINDLDIHITASFGIAAIDYTSNFEFSSAYKAADMALYRAKEEGRNRVVSHSNSI